VIDATRHVVKDGSGFIVPHGAKHNVINTSAIKNLKLYTVYSPPGHQDKVYGRQNRKPLPGPRNTTGSQPNNNWISRNSFLDNVTIFLPGF